MRRIGFGEEKRDLPGFSKRFIFEDVGNVVVGEVVEECGEIGRHADAGEKDGCGALIGRDEEGCPAERSRRFFGGWFGGFCHVRVRRARAKREAAPGGHYGDRMKYLDNRA